VSIFARHVRQVRLLGIKLKTGVLMKKSNFISFFRIAMPLSLTIACAINFLIIFGNLAAIYSKIGMILVCICSVISLVRQIIYGKYFKEKLVTEQASPLSPTLSRIIVIIFVTLLSVWGITTFWVLLI
jgi:hypothetical protein